MSRAARHALTFVTSLLGFPALAMLVAPPRELVAALAPFALCCVGALLITWGRR